MSRVPTDQHRLARRSVLRLIAAAAGAAAMTSLAAACGSPSQPAATTAPTAQPTSAANPTAAAKPTEAANPTAAATKPAAASGLSGSDAAFVAAAKLTPRPGNTAVRLVTWTAAANLPTWKAALEAFQKKYEKIDVTLEYTPSTSYWDKLSVEYAGGTPPDVIYGGPSDAQRIANQGMLLDLTQHIADDKINLDDISPSAQRPYMWAGKIWGIAAWMDTRYTIYNKTLFKDAGLPDLPQTWDAPEFTTDKFLEYCQKLTNPSKQTWGYVFEGSAPAARLIWLFGATYYDSLDYPTKAVMDSPEGIQAFQWLQDLVYKYKVAPSPAENMGGSDPMFQTGKIGMIWGGFKSAAAVHQAIKNFEWTISTVPKGTRQMSNISPQAFAIVSKTKVPDQAWAVTKFVTADEGNAIMCQKTSMPANKNVDFSKVSPLQPWQNKLLQDGLKTGMPEVPHPNIKPIFTTIITEEMDQLFANAKTGEQVAKSMASRINAAFQPYVVPK